MMLLFICSAVLVAIEAFYFLWLRERSWIRVILPRKRIVFPSLCPSCIFGTPETDVVEGSFSRTVGPTRKEFVSLSVPYCKVCGTALNQDRKRAWNTCVALVIMIVAGSWLWMSLNAPVGHEFLGTASMIGLPIVWPIYSLSSHRKRAFCARRYNQHVIDVRVKHAMYAEALRHLNRVG